MKTKPNQKIKELLNFSVSVSGQSPGVVLSKISDALGLNLNAGANLIKLPSSGVTIYQAKFTGFVVYFKLRNNDKKCVYVSVGTSHSYKESVTVENEELTSSQLKRLKTFVHKNQDKFWTTTLTRA